MTALHLHHLYGTLKLSSVRNVEVIGDKYFSLEKQVNAVAKSCYYHLRNIGDCSYKALYNLIMLVKLVQLLVTSRLLDYGNALVYGLPSSTIG